MVSDDRRVYVDAQIFYRKRSGLLTVTRATRRESMCFLVATTHFVMVSSEPSEMGVSTEFPVGILVTPSADLRHFFVARK